jgi:hypothetical protein
MVSRRQRLEGRCTYPSLEHVLSELGRNIDDFAHVGRRRRASSPMLVYLGPLYALILNLCHVRLGRLTTIIRSYTCSWDESGRQRLDETSGAMARVSVGFGRIASAVCACPSHFSGVGC